MSNQYVAVQWNSHKRAYDRILLGFSGLYLLIFVGLGLLLYPAPADISPPVLLIRATGTLALLLLHVLLAIGPLARLGLRVEAFLYNRRHLGVCVFAIGLLHAMLVLAFYGGFGVDGPFKALLGRQSWDGSLLGFPFELLGLFALTILFLMAATSHDFWLANLGSGFWKALHLGVVLAYGGLVGHVALGAMQSEPDAPWPILLLLGAGLLTGLHLLAGVRAWRRDSEARGEASGEGWIRVSAIEDIPMDRARVVRLPQGGAAAVYRWSGGVHAVESVCSHQGGPLEEGKVVDGCITCPWHGYQYLPETGGSPPPFEEQLAVYPVRVQDGIVSLNPQAKEIGP